MKNDTFRTRLVAIIIIASVLVLAAAVTVYSDSSSSASDAKTSTVRIDSAYISKIQTLLSYLVGGSTDIDTGVADLTQDGQVTLADAIMLIRTSFSGYKRSDLSGTAVGSSVLIGENVSEYTSVNGVAVLGGSIYASDETGMHIYKLSGDGTKQKIYSANEAVNAVVANGIYIYSLEGGPSGRVVKLTSDLDVISSCEVGHTPSDMAIAGNKGYVANRFSNTVSVIDLEKMQILSTVAIDGREPIAAVSAGTDIYIACHLPDEAMTESVVSANVVVISQNDTVSAVIPLVNGASGVKDICVSPDGKSVYVSHVIGRYAYPTTQLDRGWINTNGFSIIDTATKACICACLLDEVDEGAANPWGITVSGNGKYLCASLSGLDEVMLIDVAKLQTRLNQVKNGSHPNVKSLSDIVNYLPFLDGCRERITVGKGVRAIAESNGYLYCGLYFDGAIDVINLADRSVKRMQFVNQPKANAVRKGQMLWSDANNCYQRWQSCNSCHPDASIDGFNWDNLNDGLGNGKSAKSMLYSHRTPPVMVTGIRTNAEIAVAAGMKFIQFNTMSSEELSYIDEYLKSLAPIPSPALQKDGILTESAKSGEALFEKNCASCHPAPLYTDLKEHKVGTSKLAREDGYFDTPTLVEVWRTAPYLHDGSLNTLEEVIKFFAKGLSSSDVTKLCDYVRSIGNNGEYYGVEQVHGTDGYNTYIDGMQISSITIRRQSKESPAVAVLAFNVYDKKGNQVYYCDTAFYGLAPSQSATVTLEDAVTLPNGGYYTATFYDAATGEVISSVLKVN